MNVVSEPSGAARRGVKPLASHVRYLVIAVATGAAVLLYLERVCVAVAGDYIREDLRLTAEQMSLAYGIFFIAYALGQVPSGWLTDRFGPRRMMTIYLIGWSVFGMAIAGAVDFWMLLAARFLLGLSQAGAYPTLAVLVKRWAPAGARGLASGVVAFGGRVGGAGANALTAFLIVAFVPLTVPARLQPEDILDAQQLHRQLIDRQPETLQPLRERVRQAVSGADLDGKPAEDAAALEDALNRAISRPGTFDDLPPPPVSLSRDGERIRAKPEARRSSAESERLNRLLLEKAFPGSVRQLHGAGWRPALLVYGLGGVLVAVFFAWIVRDTPARHPWCNGAEATLINEGVVAPAVAPQGGVPWAVLLGNDNLWCCSATQFFSNIGWVFVITLMPSYLAEVFQVPIEQRGLMATAPLLLSCGGMLAGGWLTDRLTRTLGRRWGRAIPAGGVKVLCVAALLACPWLPSAWAVTAALAVMAIAVDLGAPAIWAYAQDVGGPRVGVVLGWSNMWGNLGAGLSPVLLTAVQKQFGWDAVFYLSAGMFVVAGITGGLINASIPLAAEREGAE